MQRLPPHLIRIEGEPRFWERLAKADQRTLILDYDGTLAPFRERRMDAAPLDGIVPLLGRIRDGGTGLSIVSGRPVAELLALLGDLRIPLVGSHGAESRDAEGRVSGRRPTGEQETLFARAVEEAQELGYAQRVERKPASLALHTRGLEPALARRAEDDLRERWSEGAAAAGLECRDFSGGIELRLRGVNKGTVVHTRLRDASRDGLVVYIGDDETDEDAFRALRGRGIGIRVGHPAPQTQATGRLPDPAAVREFLEGWLELTEVV